MNKWSTHTTHWVNGVVRHVPTYRQWSAMKQRCKDSYLKTRPNYEGCTFDASWESYDVFYAWAEKQVGFLLKDVNGRAWQLDKDLLTLGNKVYAPEFCVLVPQEINSFIRWAKVDRDLPLGVRLSKDKNKYEAKLRGVYLGSYSTPEAAFYRYKVAREVEARRLALKYMGLIDNRATEALYQHTVNIEIKRGYDDFITR